MRIIRIVGSIFGFIVLCFNVVVGQDFDLLKLAPNIEIEDSSESRVWNFVGSNLYRLSLDSANKVSGEISVSISNAGDSSGFSALLFDLPDNYTGDTLKVSASIKTDNIVGGYAGLMVRIDPGIAFKNMNDQGIVGTTDWSRYEVSVPMKSAETTRILLGGLMVGKGKMWIDDLEIWVDGQLIESLGDQSKVKFLSENHETPGEMAIEFPRLDDGVVYNLDLLGRVWGLTKYYHSQVSLGSYNLDNELFKFLPSYLQARDAGKRDSLLNNWISSCGELKTNNSSISAGEGAFIKRDMSWISEFEISEELRKRLELISSHRTYGSHHYYKIDENTGKPIFLNEEVYEDSPYPKSGARLLSLFRYWNIIQYFYPNRELIDVEWSSILTDFIPEFLNAVDELEYETVVLKLLAEIDDSHAYVLSGANKVDSLRGGNIAPLDIRFLEGNFIVAGHRASKLEGDPVLSIGDIITHINGKDVNKIVDSVGSYYSASNREAQLRDISQNLLRSNGNRILIDYISKGDSLRTWVDLFVRDSLEQIGLSRVNADSSFSLIDNGIGYISMSNISKSDVSKFKDYFSDTKGVIFDLRGYPSASVSTDLASLFVDKPVSFAKFSVSNSERPGEFNLYDGPQIPSRSIDYDGKIIILVDEMTQSLAEYTAMALRAVDGTIVVGSKTAGADGDVSIVMLPGGISTMISGVGIYYPDGTQTQRIGIVPDLIVNPTVNGLVQGKDEVLEKAIELLSTVEN